MRITSVRFKKLANLGNYENEELAVEVLVEDGENAGDAITYARVTVETNLAEAAERRRKVLEERIAAEQEAWNRRRSIEAAEDDDEDETESPF